MDGGPGFTGKDWVAFAQTFNIVLAASPTGASNQMGAIERHVELLKAGISRIASDSPNLSFENLVLQACLAKNHCAILN